MELGDDVDDDIGEAGAFADGGRDDGAGASEEAEDAGEARSFSARRRSSASLGVRLGRSDWFPAEGRKLRESLVGLGEDLWTEVWIPMDWACYI